MSQQAKNSLASCARAAGVRCRPAPPTSAEVSQGALAKLARKPVANLISVPFQNNFHFNFGALDSIAGQLQQLD